MLIRSGDIRDQRRRLYKIDRNLACFWLPFFRGESPPNFWIQFLKLTLVPIMWQSFAAIGRGSAEIWRRKKRKTSRAFLPCDAMRCTVFVIVIILSVGSRALSFSDPYYRAMHFSAYARSWDRMSSVRPSVTLVDCDHIGWKSWKLFTRTTSPTPSLFVAKRRST